MPRDILGSNDVTAAGESDMGHMTDFRRVPYDQSERAQRSPQRELSFYGSIRRGWHKVIEGLEEIEDVCAELSSKDPDNVRMQRYCQAIQKLYENAHKLNMKASRIKVSTGSY